MKIEKEYSNILYQNEETRNKIIKELSVQQIVDGSVSVDPHAAVEFANYLANYEGAIKWPDDVGYDDKIKIANKIIYGFFEMYLKDYQYLASFSKN